MKLSTKNNNGRIPTTHWHNKNSLWAGQGYLVWSHHRPKPPCASHLVCHVNSRKTPGPIWSSCGCGQEEPPCPVTSSMGTRKHPASPPNGRGTRVASSTKVRFHSQKPTAETPHSESNQPQAHTPVAAGKVKAREGEYELKSKRNHAR